MTAKLPTIAVLGAMGLALLLARPAAAVDGVIEINQARALAGHVTATDDPGFPVTIDTSGSYRLTSNLAVNGETGIQIKVGALDVTLDLNGFSIVGTPTSPCCDAGIATSGTGWVHIFNGSVRGFDSGILVVDRATIERVHQEGAAGTGIDVEGKALVTDSFAESNGASGIVVGGGSVVRGCTTSGNHGAFGAGIVAGVSSLVTGNDVHGNTNTGIHAGDGCVVMGNDVNDNEFGIEASLGSSVVDNTVRSNHNFGLSLNGASIARNVLTNNNGGDANAQFTGGWIVLGTNVCGSDTVCP